MKNLILTVFIIILAFNLSSTFYGLIDPDEPRYAATAKNMVVSNDYIVPYFNGKLRINKPPLTYWLTAISYKLFKPNEYFSRLPHIICSILIILFGVIVLGNYFLPEEKTIFAIILSSTPLFFYLGKYCNTDIIVSAFFIFSIYFFYLYYEKNKKILLYLFYISYLLTNLAKGPVAYLILIILIIFMLSNRDIKKLYNIKFWLTILLLSLTPFFYLLIVGMKVNHSFNIASLVATETFGRFIKGYRHPEPVYFYLKFFPVIFFPWSLFFVFKIFKLKTLWKQNKFMKLNIIYFFTIIIFFSLSKSKLLSYILPAAFPFACIVAKLTNDISIKIKSKYFIFLYGIVFIALLLFLIINNYTLPDYKTLIIFLSILGIFLIFIIRSHNTVFKLGLFQLLLLSTVFIIGSTFLSENKSEKFLEKVYIKKDVPIISYRRNITGIAFYAENYQQIDNIDALKKFDNFYLVSYKSDFNKIKEQLKICKKIGETKLKIMVECNAINNK
jgi:4-amino-4-deoxy-L-arabinose transferase